MLMTAANFCILEMFLFKNLELGGESLQQFILRTAPGNVFKLFFIVYFYTGKAIFNCFVNK